MSLYLTAVIGGATGKRKETTEVAPTTSQTSHNYSIVITINNLSNPMITLKLGIDENKVRQITSLLSIIIDRNK